MAQHAVENPPQTDDGKEILSNFTTAEQQVQLNITPEFYNLAQDLDEAKASEIAREIKLGYEDDESSRSDWLDMHTFWLSLYMLNDYAQNSSPDRDWGATESIPILTEACNQFQSRTYKAFFPQSEFVSAKVEQHTMDQMKAKLQEERADRIGAHMSWQLGIQNRNYKKDKSALFLGTAIHGSFFTKVYFDSYKKKRPCIDNIRPTDLIIGYNCGPIRIEDVRRKTHIIHTNVAQTELYAKNGYFLESAKAYNEANRNEYDTQVDESLGLNPGKVSIRRDSPATVIEQHFFLDIDDTGNFLPYIGTVDLASGKLLRLTIGYEADPMGQPLKDYDQIQYFNHYKFMENPDGFYGLGLGHMIGDLNSAVNIMTRQAMDAATLANDGNMSGFISERLSLGQEDEMTLTLGKFKKIPDQTGDLTNGIMMMKFPGPNAALLQIIQELDARAQRLGSTTEATTGTIDTNRQPTTVLAQIEQSLELFSSVQLNLADALTDELQKIYRLNQKYLPFVEYFTINDAPQQVTRSDYQDDMTVVPVFDPKFSTRSQKVAKAQAEIQATMQNPLSQTRPWVYDVAFRRYLEALEVENIDELIPPPQTPQGMILNALHQQQFAPSQPGAAPSMAQGANNGMGNGATPPDIQAAPGFPPNQAGGPPGSQLGGGFMGGN